VIMGQHVCYYCHQMLALDKERPGAASLPVVNTWALLKPEFGKHIHIKVCRRPGCVGRAKADGYEFRSDLTPKR
jgi:hypothetical protein